MHALLYFYVLAGHLPKKISMLDKVTKKQTMQKKNLEFINTKKMQDLMLKIIFWLRTIAHFIPKVHLPVIVIPQFNFSQS